jgi:hypothetical protein
MLQFLAAELGCDPTRATLVKNAERLARAQGIPITRSTKRSREKIVVWFSDHAHEIFPELFRDMPDTATAKVAQSRREPMADVLSQIFDAKLACEEEVLLFYDP